MVRRDFSALLKVFEEQLAISSDNEVERRVHINEARSAAERGIKLSNELIDMLRSRTS
jgi:Na+/H+ antiporter NhaB